MSDDGTGRWSVYLLKCPRGIYCGITTDPARRFSQHSNGTGAKSVRALGKPEFLQVVRTGLTKSEALKLEMLNKKLPASSKRQVLEMCTSSDLDLRFF